MELSRKRDAKGETYRGEWREAGVEGCKESPSWQNGSIECECVCKHFPRAFSSRMRGKFGQREEGDETAIKSNMRGRGEVKNFL